MATGIMSQVFTMTASKCDVDRYSFSLALFSLSLFPSLSTGVGADPREDRYFNVPKQSSTYDADAAYMKHWCPELSKLPPTLLHHPYNITPDIRAKYGITTDVYPEPVVPLRFTSFSKGGGGGGRVGKSSGYSGPGRGGSGGGGGGGGGRRPPSSDKGGKSQRGRRQKLQHDFMEGGDA